MRRYKDFIGDTMNSAYLIATDARIKLYMNRLIYKIYVAMWFNFFEPHSNIDDKCR